MLIPFGILSAAGEIVDVAGTYELISTTILGGTASSVTFSNLGDYSSTYKHLQLRVAGNNTTSGAWRFRLNGDTGNNYSYHLLFGNGSSVASVNGTSESSGYFGFATANANVSAASVMDILDFASTTKNKTTRTLNGDVNFNVILASSAWYSTDAVTSLTLLANVNFVTGSRFSLYGIKG
jgi:hypothetical protein